MIVITEINKNNLIKIKSVLDNSGVIVFPTETVWGLGCKYDDEKAVSRIYSIKGRNESNPLQIQVSGKNDFEIYSYVNNNDCWNTISSQFLPGPLSVISKKKKNVPDFVTANLDTVAFRYSSCNYLLDLIDFLGYPIASTSCNLSGEQVITDKDEIFQFSKKHADVLIDIECGNGNISSTIISLINNEIKLIREGLIKFDDIKKGLEK